MKGVLVLGSIEAGRLSAASIEAAAVGAQLAREIGTEVTGALFGHEIGVAGARFASAGFTTLRTIDDSRLESYTSDTALAAAIELVRSSGADTILVPSDANSIEWASRLAARLGASIAGNCTAISANPHVLICSRPVAGGALQAQFRTTRAMRVILLTPGQDVEPVEYPPCEVISIGLPLIESRIEVIEFIADDVGSGPQLKNAQIVVSGGMGIGSAANWSLVEGAADALGAAVGATRAAVEVGWAQPSKQVGFSGLKVSPDLYLAVGISGALHHLAGIARAKKIVAVNNDPDANIFKASHLGVIGDVKEVIPAFIERARELRA